jgi:hypothetical protein
MFLLQGNLSYQEYYVYYASSSSGGTSTDQGLGEAMLITQRLQ